MVSLPGWGGPWERRERLGSDSSDNAKKRYNPTHPGVHQTSNAPEGYGLPNDDPIVHAFLDAGTMWRPTS